MSGRLRLGGGDVASGWRKQLDRNVAALLPAGTPVWLRGVGYCAGRLRIRAPKFVRRSKTRQTDRTATTHLVRTERDSGRVRKSNE